MENNSDFIFENMTRQELADVSARIIYLRQNILQYSQLQFAAFIKLSQTYLSLIESGKKHVNSSIVRKIVTTFNVNMDWLLYGTGGDDNIFQSDIITKELITSSIQEDALNSLQKAYSLKEKDLTFLSAFLSWERKEKDAFLSALNTIKKLV